VLALGASILAVGAAQTSGAGYGPSYGPSYSPPPSPSPKKKPKKSANKVTIKGSSGSYRFSPSSLHAKKGATVHWSWSSDAPHNVTFSKLHKHSSTTSKGSYKLSFSKSGSYSYRCTIHGFTGTIVVR
jgi:plastocyanin